jgi:hypothetical protein
MFLAFKFRLLVIIDSSQFFTILGQFWPYLTENLAEFGKFSRKKWKNPKLKGRVKRREKHIYLYVRIFNSTLRLRLRTCNVDIDIENFPLRRPMSAARTPLTNESTKGKKPVCLSSPQCVSVVVFANKPMKQTQGFYQKAKIWKIFRTW